MSYLSLVPHSLEEANAFVDLHHRHNDPAVGHIWSMGAELDGPLVGAIMTDAAPKRRAAPEFREAAE